MGISPTRWYHSLKVKITLLLLLGGAMAGGVGVWVTYSATDSQLEQRLLVRVRTLASSVNHAAMATSDWSVVQHMIWAIVDEETDIRNIMVVGKATRRILAASSPAEQGLILDDLPDDHLRHELADALRHGTFGSHFESDNHPDHAGNLVILVPLQPTSVHQGVGGLSGSQRSNGHEAHRHDHARGMPHHEPGTNKLAAIGTESRSDPGSYRGVILIVASKNVVLQGVRDVLWRYVLLLIAAVVVILRIAYMALNNQVLRPLSSIHAAIDRRKSGDTTARVALSRQDEISAVAQTLNETLDNEDEQGRQLSRINEQLTQAVATAETANVAKSAFLANMSHELRTPLNAIVGFSDIMRTETLGPVGSPRYKEYSRDINHAGLHLLNLINDLLDLSKIEADKDELFEEDIDIRATIDSVVSMVRQRAENNDIAMKFEIEQDIPGLRADERKLKQILTNLLTNAIKFTKPGGLVTTVVRFHDDGGFLVQVTDTGIGIAPDDIPKALSQFGQVDCDFNRKYEGTGLGLSLTKAIAELHGGSLEIESQVGAGTTVTVRFPAWRVIFPARSAYVGASASQT